MTVVCAPPDTSLGVALRLSSYLDCQARALGENGFQALAGGPLGTGLLSGLVTVFVALIGYRLMLGQAPDVRDGVGWAVRLGIVLALVTSWPAFQALVYRVAVDAPVEIAGVLLPAAGVSAESLDSRIQQSYDVLRLGTTIGQPTAATAQPGAAVDQQQRLGGPLAKTASLLVIATAGLAGALRIAIGFLLSVAPLAIMSLLFSGTNGLFIGWLRAAAGLALGLAGANVVTAIHLVALESELAHLQALGAAEAGPGVDPQGLTTMVIFFALIALVTTLAAMRMGNALRLPQRDAPLLSAPIVRNRAEPQPLAPHREIVRGRAAPVAPGAAGATERAKAVADILSGTVHREQRMPATASHHLVQRAGPASIAAATEDHRDHRVVERIGVAGRRSIGRRTRSAARRDKVA